MARDPKERAAALEKLVEDWKAENSDAREEGVTKWQLTNQIQNAKARSEEDREDADRLLDLANAYGVLDPLDKRCLNVLERMMKSNLVNTMDTQRQGEAYQLFGRSLFFANRFEESLTALLRAQVCFKEKGNFKVRRSNNRALLRVYCSLGRGREASERLEVALTLVENDDDAVMLYISAKQALEHTGEDRDREILDDIWYVYLDMHPEAKSKFEGYMYAGEGVLRQTAGGEERQEDPPVTWAEMWDRVKDPEAWKEALPLVMDDLKKSAAMRTLLTLTGFFLMMYVAIMLSIAMKGR